MLAAMLTAVFMLVSSVIYLPIVANNGIPSEIGDAVEITFPPDAPIQEDFGWPAAKGCDELHPAYDKVNALVGVDDRLVLCNLDTNAVPFFGLDVQEYDEDGWIAFEDGFAQTSGTNGAGEPITLSWLVWPEMEGTPSHLDLRPGYDVEHFEWILSGEGFGQRSACGDFGCSQGWMTYKVIDWDQYDYPVITEYKVQLKYWAGLETELQTAEFWMKVQ